MKNDLNLKPCHPNKDFDRKFAFLTPEMEVFLRIDSGFFILYNRFLRNYFRQNLTDVSTVSMDHKPLWKSFVQLLFN